MSKKLISVLAIALIPALFAGAAYMLYSPRWVYEVCINGEPVGCVKSLEEYNHILADIYARAGGQWHCELAMNEKVSVKKIRQWAPTLSPAQVQAKIEAAATYITSGWALEINGKTAAFVSSEQTALDLMEAVKNYYLPHDPKRILLSVNILDDIIICQKPVEPELLLDRDTAFALLLSGQEETSRYVVKRGDTLSGIARSYQTSVSTLRSANPEVAGDTIQVGQVLNLETSSALLHVQTVEELTTTETISRPVKYQANSDMSVRGDKILKAGSDGSKKVTYRLEVINGSEVKREQVACTVTRQPETKVVLTGIGYWPALPTGIFRFPLNQGRISSSFGWRRNGFHRGVDIATSRGTPIYAAADGIVTRRTSSASYGNYVAISHTGGYSTLYAHVKSISPSVRVGEKVARGQVIAWVGSTGISTGSHLHWEVIRNGKPLDPINFFSN